MEQSYKIALAGNPNSGKTTLYNRLTGSNQFVGNWPGVTVEKKEGTLKRHTDTVVVDLPGVYSLSPYTPEEVVARNFLVGERPDAILNIVDGTNLERNLYLTTQLMELGIPVVVAINMMDAVEKSGDKLDTKLLGEKLGCPVVEISALKGKGVAEAADAAWNAAKEGKTVPPLLLQARIEEVLNQIEETALAGIPAAEKRWYAVKLFERDEQVRAMGGFSPEVLARVERLIQEMEEAFDDDAESIISSERYDGIGRLLADCYRKTRTGKLSVSDKIDRVVTNRWLGLPIFALVMFLVYFLSMVTVGQVATDFVNDGLFGDGWHLFGIGSNAYEEAQEEYSYASAVLDGYETYIEENGSAPAESFLYAVEDEETLAVTYETATLQDYEEALAILARYEEEPDPAAYGVWVPGIPALVGRGLEAANAAPWLSGLLCDGVIAGVGAVLGFVPQMFVLFLLLAILEACGYMSRIAFILDRVFRKFGLSGKSFIPMLIGVGCGVPGIMASRTIENDRDRRMTVMTTTFIPCGAKVPFIAMIAGAVFGGSPWVATSAYFIGMAAVVVSGILLKKTKMFAGEPAPFVMELPAYRMPGVVNTLRSMWERGWSFIKKAGTIILLSTVVVWFFTYFGVVDDSFRMLEESELDSSLLAAVGSIFAWIFKPLGWGTWQAAVASLTGLVAKENIVGTMGILYGATGDVYGALGAAFNGVTGFSFLVFNLLCAPCFAAIGAIKREMNSPKWTWFAIGYQCAFAYTIALMINQFGRIFIGGIQPVGLVAAVALFGGLLYLLLRPHKKVRVPKEKEQVTEG
ncbi:MAG: ferrous iron transporter B [Clostridia bacterium]|nr:ferrous iron transporter B [Clostridia bacterium]MDY6184951.1 ferrous iron transporter B [Eubacteriales bacterium]